MLGIVTFIIIFGVLVLVHEFGHFYFAKKSGILVREFAIGMGPKIFSHIDKEGTAYTIRILPLGGYVRMAGWGDDTTEIKTGTPASLTLNAEGQVVRINLSQKQVDMTSLPINILTYDLEDALEITGVVLDETKTYSVNHDATIIEEDGTEIRIAPLDVQYQNASIWGRLITNFAGPMNNFILGTLVFILLVFMQGGVADESSNQIQVVPNGALA
ncbi:MAG: site-2 protease family protein, partial [Streptococcus orisratti]